MLFFIIGLIFTLIFLIAFFGDYDTKEMQNDYVKFDILTKPK